MHPFSGPASADPARQPTHPTHPPESPPVILRIGDQVLITQGSFSGVQGIVRTCAEESCLTQLDWVAGVYVRIPRRFLARVERQSHEGQPFFSK